MIHCQLHGRLGNNLFTIATGLSLAKKLNTNLTIDKVTSAGHRGYIPVDLSIFGYKFNQINTPKLDNVYNETETCYSPINIQDNTILSGIFGYWKHFEDIKEELYTKYFIPSEKINNDLKKYNIPSNSLGICVRRGDFLMLQHNHCVLTADYYQEAINKYFQNNIDSIYVFSDDFEWCKTVFGDSVNYIEDKVGVQLFLMTKMKHLIMANSTFSWWGAYLNKNNGIIVAPDPWLGPSYDHIDASDSYYPSWIKHKHIRIFQEYNMSPNFFN
jgi:hypothetical protein